MRAFDKFLCTAILFFCRPAGTTSAGNLGYSTDYRSSTSYLPEDPYWEEDTCQDCCCTEAPSAQSISHSFNADTYGQCSMPWNSDSWDSDFPAESVPSPEPTILSVAPPSLQISRPIASQPTDHTSGELPQYPDAGPIIVRLTYPPSQTYYPTDVA